MTDEHGKAIKAAARAGFEPPRNDAELAAAEERRIQKMMAAQLLLLHGRAGPITFQNRTSPVRARSCRMRGHSS